MQLITISELAEQRAGLFTESALRNLINKASPLVDRRMGRVLRPGNGLIEAGAIIRLGRRVLIDEERFNAWLLAHRVGGGSSC
jgi:hypothetical protein